MFWFTERLEPKPEIDSRQTKPFEQTYEDAIPGKFICVLYYASCDILS